MRSFLSFTFGEKSFTESDYTKHLFSAVYSIANLEPTIFVGRGAHLILPRDRVLAIRVICSDKFRVERLAKMLNEKEEQVEKKLGDIDREQDDFFKRVYGLKNASPYEFDMVVNCDYIKESAWAAEIVALAFKEKYS